MKTTIHVVCILLIGVGLGMAIRQLRGVKNTARGPAPGEVVFTNDGGTAANALKSTEIENPTPAKPAEDANWLSEFELTERSGETVSSDDLLGQPYVVSFFFSTCPSICVQQNQQLQALQEQFSDRGVRFVAISVDPETDTPAVLREYAARFGADEDQWLFLTGDLNYIRRVGGEIFQQPVDKKFHTERFALVDARGEIEGFYTWTQKRQLQALEESIVRMLDEDS